MNKQKYFVFPVVFMAYVLSLTYSSNLYAQPQGGHERVVAPSVGKLESEGAKIVSGFKFKSLNFLPQKVDRVVLENGMILYLLEDHDLPIFNITARIRTGAIYEPQEKAGLASLTGFVMRRGGTVAFPAPKNKKENNNKTKEAKEVNNKSEKAAE